MHISDIDWIIRIQHNTVEYLTMIIHTQDESTALISIVSIKKTTLILIL
jgi:hypothetical protein